jgi:hypothetical protein
MAWKQDWREVKRLNSLNPSTSALQPKFRHGARVSEATLFEGIEPCLLGRSSLHESHFSMADFSQRLNVHDEQSFRFSNGCGTHPTPHRAR